MPAGTESEELKMIAATRTLLLWLVFALVFTTPVWADDDDYLEGAQYQELPLAPAPLQDGRVEVVEFFFYGCPHCHSFEPYLEEWLKTNADNVAFTRVPAIFNGRWEALARAYYTAEILGVMDKIHTPLFDAIHKDHKNIFGQEAIREFFVAHGVSAEDFDNTFSSFAVHNKIRQARQLQQRYRIQGVPTMVIGGHYVTNATMAGSHTEAVKVTNYLIKKEKG